MSHIIVHDARKWYNRLTFKMVSVSWSEKLRIRSSHFLASARHELLIYNFDESLLFRDQEEGQRGISVTV